MSLSQFLVWLTAGGSIVAVSWLCEKWAWFQAQEKDIKQYVIFGSSAVLSIAAQLFMTYVDPAVLEMLTPYFAMLSTIFGSVFLGQAFFRLMKKPANG